MVNNDPPPAVGGAVEEGVLNGFGGAGVAPLGGLNMKVEPVEPDGRFALLLAGEAG